MCTVETLFCVKGMTFKVMGYKTSFVKDCSLRTVELEGPLLISGFGAMQFCGMARD